MLKLEFQELIMEVELEQAVYVMGITELVLPEEEQHILPLNLDY